VTPPAKTPLAVIGAGPAGISACLAAVRAGLRPTLLDDGPAAGGQIYRQVPCEFRSPGTPHRGVLQRSAARGGELLRAFDAIRDRVDHVSRATVWGVFGERQLAYERAGAWSTLHAEQIILATGAYEWMPPFPGWTLPGVMTPGAAQGMAKTMHVKPGTRALVAGSGPFLLVVANQLQAAGVEVVAVVEAASRSGFVAALPQLLRSPRTLFDGASLVRALRRAGIPLLYGWRVVEASGEGTVERVTAAPCDADWRVDPARSRSFAIDTLCVGFGFVPQVQLAQLLGCELAFSDELGGWIPKCSPDLETTVPGIWVAGDGGGVAGSYAAELEGTLAGLHAAHRAGALSAQDLEREKSPLVRQRVRWRSFRAAMDQISRPRAGLFEQIADDTIVCRCEELTLGEVQRGVQAGGRSLRSLKVMTRLGMGPCQGRMCWPYMARYLAHRCELSHDHLGPISVRPPIKPVSLGLLAASPSEEP
jgi:NADPH-dependent 2,4-dienoyl-CoA reductase/sulfur reductase-like enzyme